MSSITKITTITREKFQKKLYSNYEKHKEIVDLRDGREMENDILLGGERNLRLRWGVGVVKWLKSNSDSVRLVLKTSGVV